jgi:group I intron endonuclease
MENKKVYGRVYLITNLVNNKQYVGQTIKTIKHRFKGHCYRSKYNNTVPMAITKAIKKYGEQNFKIEEIATAYSQKQLNFTEGFFIKSLNTLAPNGYNLKSFINGKGKYSEETKEKMKIALNNPERLKLQSETGKKRRGKSYVNSSSKYVGVYLIGNRYRSSIGFNNKTFNLGLYYNETDAAKAYDISAIKYYGKDCILNFENLREDYINNEISINRIEREYSSKSGEKNVLYNKAKNLWVYKWFNKTLNKYKTKSFKQLKDAIEFKHSKPSD